MSAPSVSVVMPVWNGLPYLADALESLRAQTRAPDEVIVVDDGSTDGSGALVASLLPSARVVRQENGGVSAALARGVAEARGDLVAFLEADDVWRPDKLQREVAYFAAHADVGHTLCHADVFLEPGTPRPTWLRAQLLEAPVLLAFMSALVVRRSAFASVGGFDPSYRYGQDTEWLMRAQHAGIVRAILPETLVRRRIHGTNLSTAQRHSDTMLRIAREAMQRRNATERGA